MKVKVLTTGWPFVATIVDIGVGVVWVVFDANDGSAAPLGSNPDLRHRRRIFAAVMCEALDEDASVALAEARLRAEAIDLGEPDASWAKRSR